ncbi:hypothetical protein GJ496_003532, partial [Pomphorhynchus laevis]
FAFLPAVFLFGITMTFITVAGIIQQPIGSLASMGVIMIGIAIYISSKKVSVSDPTKNKINSMIIAVQTTINSAPTASY